MSARHRNREAVSGESLRSDVREAIDRAWPDGIVEQSYDPDESYVRDIEEDLSAALRRLPNTHVVYERGAEAKPVWWEGSDPDEDPPDEVEPTRSYHLFFISPNSKAFTFETEVEDFDCSVFRGEEANCEQDAPLSYTLATGQTGWAVAVSEVAPFAAIELTDVVDGGSDQLGIEMYGENETGELISPEESFQKKSGVEAYGTLVSLREKIADILAECGIAVLSRDEWLKPVKGLRGGEGTLIGDEGRTVRVLDAFFFEEL